MCSNNCRLTINSFGGGRRFIAGNRCERPITKKSQSNELNMYAVKLKMLEEYKPVEGLRGKLGMPMALNMFEMYPFWYRFFTELKFEVFHSPFSTRKIYQRGQQTIPSDTICVPAKLVHGHIQTLMTREQKLFSTLVCHTTLTSTSAITTTTALLLHIIRKLSITI